MSDVTVSCSVESVVVRGYWMTPTLSPSDVMTTVFWVPSWFKTFYVSVLVGPHVMAKEPPNVSRFISEQVYELSVCVPESAICLLRLRLAKLSSSLESILDSMSLNRYRWSATSWFTSLWTYNASVIGVLWWWVWVFPIFCFLILNYINIQLIKKIYFDLIF